MYNSYYMYTSRFPVAIGYAAAVLWTGVYKNMDV